MTAKTKTPALLKFEVRSRWTGDVQFVAEIEADEDASFSLKLGLAVKWALKSGANLGSANLGSANLYGANLYGANLRSADLRSADLGSADLRSADLRSANLYGADLRSANLGSADLSGADLRSANLGSANLGSANLSGANLYGANLYGANLYGANLYGANLGSANLGSADLRSADLGSADLRSADLRSANLYGANLGSANLGSANLSSAVGADLAIARTRILPEGEIIGWKKCKGDVIAKLLIPASAKRSHAFGRKCRAEYVDVLEIFGADKGISLHDGKTEYVAGQRVSPDSFDENWREECAAGIHFYLSRIEAEHHI